VILALDVPVNKEAGDLAAEHGVKIFTAEVMNQLFDEFTVRGSSIIPFQNLPSRWGLDQGLGFHDRRPLPPV